MKNYKIVKTVVIKKNKNNTLQVKIYILCEKSMKYAQNFKIF